MTDLKTQTITNLFWRFMERCGAQLVSFVVSIILARLLCPDDYGMISLVTVFISIFNVFIDSGLGTALVQKKDADSIDFSSVFYFNIVMCVALYFVMFISASAIADFYGMPELVSVVRVLGLTLVISGIKNVQQAYVSRHLIFKKFFYATLLGTIIAAVVGIGMAYLGYGVWALVAQQLINASIDSCILWITVKWRPTLEFSYRRMKSLFIFGWRILASSLVNTVYGNIRQLIIGRLYSPSDLAYYNRGKTFPYFVVNNINSSIDSVLLPVLSKEQDNIQSVKNMTRKAIMISSYIMWPMMIGLAVTAESVIMLFLGTKWLSAVPYMRIWCIILALEPIQTANLNAIKAMGRSDLFLRLEVIKKVVGLVIILSVTRYGVLAIAYSGLFYTVFASVVNASPNKRLLNYSYISQLKDIVPSLALSLIMAFVVYILSYMKTDYRLMLMLQTIVGVTIYMLLSILFKPEPFVFITNILRHYMAKEKSKQ